jgi:hypothetical protein
MLALVVAVGGIGLALLASSLFLSPETSVEPDAEELALRSVTVVPFVANDDPSLAPAAFRVATDVAQLLAEAMPHVRFVAGGEGGRAADGAATRIRLEGEVSGRGDDVEVTLRVSDGRDGRVVEASRETMGRARFPDAGARLTASARRLLTAAMLRAAAAG